MNKDYRYPYIELWDDETWKGTDAPIHPLVKELLKAAYAKVLPAYKTGKFSGRSDAVPDPKYKACVFDDVVAALAAKGLEFHITAMGFVAWMALIPENHTRDTKTLLVFTCADMDDPMWAMDMTEYYKDYADKAAKNGFAVLFLVYRNTMPAGIYTDIALELSALWRIDMKKVYLDVSLLDRPLEAEGLDRTLFDRTEDFCGVTVVDATEKWQATTAHQYICKTLNSHNKEFDVDRFVHSTLGRKIAESMHMEKNYRRWNDEGLLKEFDEKGIVVEEHYYHEERWLSVMPKNAEKDLPLLICMKEVRPSCEFQTVTALQFYYDYLDVAANGECALLFFALESPDDNELLTEIIGEMTRMYGIDKSRVYITGQSHNGCFALEYARRRHDIIAACATLNDRHGFASPRYSVDNVKITDKMVDDFASFDLPLININGAIENVFPHTEPGSEAFYNQVDAMHRRYKAFRIRDRSDEEIIAALNSPDKATRMNGIPADRTETVYSMGFEAYISDFMNEDGNYHLRLVTLENLPHMITPSMVELSWSFLRRFAKDENGRTVELN